MSNLYIGQINIAKSNIKQYVIFNSLSYLNFYIICIQDCWIGEIHFSISIQNSAPPTFYYKSTVMTINFFLYLLFFSILTI